MNNQPIKKKLNFLSNKELLRYIHESKASYGVYSKPEYKNYDEIVDDLSKSTATPGQVVRMMTTEDTQGIQNERGKPPVINFPPFRHYLKTETGWELVGKSQWKGDLNTGNFTSEKGKLTNELAKALMLMIDKYSNKPNWRRYSYLDEMKGSALVQLLVGVLKFNEFKSDNPFAYITTIMSNSFTRVWSVEKRQQVIRDDLLVFGDLSPSFTMTHNHEFEQELKRNTVNQTKTDEME